MPAPGGTRGCRLLLWAACGGCICRSSRRGSTALGLRATVSAAHWRAGSRVCGAGPLPAAGAFAARGLTARLLVGRPDIFFLCIHWPGLAQGCLRARSCHFEGSTAGNSWALRRAGERGLAVDCRGAALVACQCIPPLKGPFTCFSFCKAQVQNACSSTPSHFWAASTQQPCSSTQLIWGVLLHRQCRLGVLPESRGGRGTLISLRCNLLRSGEGNSLQGVDQHPAALSRCLVAVVFGKLPRPLA